jgi:ribose transport system ATP-binding protein
VTVDPVLEVVDVDKSFPGVRALRRVSFALRPGEVHALVGENGAGKSTLIKLLTGVYQPDGGELRYRGARRSFGTPLEAQRAGISTIYQEVNLIPLMSVARNMMLGREPRTRLGLIDVARMNREAAEVLAGYGVRADVRQPLRTLGLGAQQMVALARAVAGSGAALPGAQPASTQSSGSQPASAQPGSTQPSGPQPSGATTVVIMDEPTSALEPREVETLFAAIRRLHERGIAVLYVSHRLDELYQICDRVTVLRDGQVVHSGALADLDRLRLVSLMLGRDLATVRREGATKFTEHETLSSTPVLEAIGLSRKNVLSDVSVTVRPGEVVGLGGLLGAGRSETAKAIAGAMPRDAGRVIVAGVPVRGRGTAAASRAGIALLPEDRKTEGIVPTLSVRENITLAVLPRLSRGGLVSRSRLDRIVRTFIERLRIKASSPDQKVVELSGGNQQKVLLARLLATQPKVLLLDEPTRGIDVGAKSEVQALVDELATQGLGVVLISSELEELIEGSDRIVVLRDGAVVGELEGAEVTEDNLMDVIAHGEPHLNAPRDAHAEPHGNAPGQAQGSGYPESEDDE